MIPGGEKKGGYMIKKIFAGRGNIVGVVLTAFTLVTLIIYLISYSAQTGLTEYSKLSGYAVGVLAASTVVGAAFILLGTRIKILNEILPYVQFALTVAALMAYVYAVYYYVSVVAVGIDLDSYDGGFVICTIAFSVCLLLATVNVFVPHKDKKCEKKGVVTSKGDMESESA